MASNRSEDSGRRQSLAYHTKQSDHSVRLAPLIAPKSKSNDKLPSLEELGLSDELLASARGVCPSPAENVGTQDLVLNDKVLREYKLQYGKGWKLFVMQAPPRNEKRAIFTRRTIGGRDLVYRLDVAQEPKQARACGNGNKSSADRRPVDPPPVVKMTILHGDIDITGHYDADFMLFATLEFSRPIANGNILATNHCPVLAGNPCVGASYLSKPSNAAYFIFSDLAVRHEGFYRLKFTLLEGPKNHADFDLDASLGVGQGMFTRTAVYTPPFQVWSAKKFPGLELSTDLSQVLADQGCRVRIRRDVRQRRARADTTSKKDDEQRALRAISHDRNASTDSPDYWPRPMAPSSANTRRPSVDSQYALGNAHSRQQSVAQSALPSPNIAEMTQYMPRPYEAPTPTASLAAESGDMWQHQSHNAYNMPPLHRTSSSMQGPQQAMAAPAPPYTTSGRYGSASSNPSDVMAGLPSISALIHPPKQPRLEHGAYDGIVSPKTGKRTLRQPSDERGASLKDRARPNLQPTSLRSPYSVYGGIQSHSVPMTGANDIIEAGEGSDDGDESDGSDGLLNTTTFYRRAGGGKSYVPNIQTSSSHAC
ncbi:hypothetical protein LTS08_008169 [Lithohypha guttulata]|nr:hypothetical protein LTS08_008169 [Lithohypha guttulata]